MAFRKDDVGHLLLHLGARFCAKIEIRFTNEPGLEAHVAHGIALDFLARRIEPRYAKYCTRAVS